MMSSPEMWPVVALLLLALGAWRTATAADVIRQLLGLNVMAAGASLLLVTVAQLGEPFDRAARTMAVVGIVVAFGVTAFGLTLARRFRAGRDPCPQGEGRPGKDPAE